MAIAKITTAALQLLAAAQQSAGVSIAITWVALGTGLTTLSAALVSGTPITSLPVAALPFGLASGASVTVVCAGASDSTVVLSAVANPGDTTLHITSWTPTFAYPAGSSVVTTPAVADTQLQREVTRLAATGVPGAAAGESLLNGYFSSAIAPGNTFCEVGFYGGAGASSALNSGTLITRGTFYWQHTSSDGGMMQCDSLFSGN